MSAVTERELETVIPEEDDPKLFRQIEQQMQKRYHAQLVGPEGQVTEIPPKMYHIMQRFAHLLATNKVVLVTPMERDLTTQEAAIYLGISRPTLVKLLEDGKIPFIRGNKHRRVRFEDIKAYREERDSRRKQALIELTQMSEEMGGYDASPEDLEAFSAA